MKTANNNHHQHLNKISFVGLLVALGITFQNNRHAGKRDRKPEKTV
ncbi:MAG: hypothetical protein M3367_16345 [Acidobacteriota bacterium]|nr:hypothetical protein [Acidobacteriota bacterium]